MAGGVSSTIQDSRRRALVRRRKRILLRNEAQLNCVSLRSRSDYVARRGLSRVEMNAQKTGALDSPLRAKGRVFHFLFDNADVVIEGILRQSDPAHPGGRVQNRVCSTWCFGRFGRALR